MKKAGDRSTLKVNKGVDQPPSVHPGSLERFKKSKKPDLSPKEYLEGILNGNRTVLSRAITLIESQLPGHTDTAREIISLVLPYTGRSMRIGITGVPGVGKSSFIEAIGGYITSHGHKLAVLAIDPSSERTRGSIMGDKTRMESLTSDPNAFIRPSPSAGSLGGVARKTRESMLLCEAAGFDVIFIETVGVGQSETTVRSMVDFFILLMLAGAGDELQGIKRGIMEMADLVAITKCDGSNIEASRKAVAQYSNALNLFPPSESGWKPKVTSFSAIKKTGLKELWETGEDYFRHVKGNGYIEKNRKSQAKIWMYDTIRSQLMDNFLNNDEVTNRIDEIEKKVANGDISSYSGAWELLDYYYNKK